MIKVIGRVGVFALFFFIILSLICIKNLLVVKSFYLGDNINKIVVGDSHGSCGIDNSLIPGTASVANTNEAYIYTYSKLKKILESHPRIDTVFLSVGYHNFSAYSDRSIYTMIYRNVYFLSLHSVIDVYKFKKASSESPYAPFLKYNLSQIFSLNPQVYFGGYLSFPNIQGLSQKAMDKRLDIQYYSNKSTAQFSESQIFYFNQIILLCRKNGVVPVGINLPLTPYFEARVPQVYKQKYESLTQDISVIDFKGLDYLPEDFLPDGDHLSSKGSVKVSTYIKDVVIGKNINRILK